MATLYGIKNCDTVKKARKWLEKHDVAYNFHDFRADGITASDVKEWAAKTDVSVLVNKRSTTWKQLSEEKKSLFDSDILTTPAIELILDHPTLLKRPIVDKDGSLLIGFKEADYTALFN